MRATGIATLLATSVVAGTGTPVAGAAAGNKMTVTAGEYTYKVSGKPKPGNVAITFDNAGVEYHQLEMAPLKAGVTAKQLQKALLSDDEDAAHDLIGNFQAAPLPGYLGGDRETTAITKLKAGRYGIFCFVPAPDGTPHVARGMVAVFDVKGSKSAYQPPADGVAEVSISDTAITLPTAGMPKSGWVKVTNDTDVTRSVIVGEYLTPDATFETADAYFAAFFGGQDAGEPPASLNGGLVHLAPGATGYFEVDFSSGRYVLNSESEEVDDDPAPLHADFTVS